MAKNFTILVGTMAGGLWRSVDGGESWSCSSLGNGFSGEKTIFGLARSPSSPNVIYAGAPDGVFRSEDYGASFEQVESPKLNRSDLFFRPVRGSQLTGVWRVAVDPSDPDTVYAGTSPAELYRSRDGGKQWELLSARFVDEIQNGVTPRVVALEPDPRNNGVLWAAVEIDGVQRSRDSGKSWQRITGGVMGPETDHTMPAIGGMFGDVFDDPATCARDVHAVVVSPSNPDRILVANRTSLCTSEDGGEEWRSIDMGDNLVTVAAAFREDNENVIFTAPAKSIDSSDFIQRTEDSGVHWERISLPERANSPIVGFATHPADPNLVLCYSRSGQVFATADGGDWWIKFPREFTRISFGGVIWFPDSSV